jgi:ribosomal protein L7/L12
VAVKKPTVKVAHPILIGVPSTSEFKDKPDGLHFTHPNPNWHIVPGDYVDQFYPVNNRKTLHDEINMTDKIELAKEIYIATIDINSPLTFRSAASNAMQAAEVFISTIEEKYVSSKDKEFYQLISQLTDNGKKIQAIKEFRAKYGVGLKEAKDSIDHFSSTGELKMFAAGKSGRILFLRKK